MSSSSAMVDFSKAIVDEPSPMLFKPPGSSIEETPIIDEVKLSSLLSAGGDSNQLMKASTAVEFHWKHTGSGQIISDGLSLKLSNVSSSDSGRYQLYAVHNGVEQAVNQQHIDVFVDSSYQVPNNSISPPTVGRYILSQNQSEQFLLVKIQHGHPGQIKSVTWKKDQNILPEYQNLKSVALRLPLPSTSEIISAVVTFEDQSSHEVSASIPLIDATIEACMQQNSCPKVCDSNRITNFSDGTGKKVEKCLADGLKLSAPVYLCNAFGSSLNSAKTSCSCPSDMVIAGNTCVTKPSAPSVEPTTPNTTPPTSSTPAYSNCSFNGQTVAHGASVTAYSSNSVAYGQSCNGVSRTCNNGTLSGSGNYASCAAQGPANCSFNGATVAHGASVTAYSTTSVSYGGSCASVAETRSCNNGSLSGSASNSYCSVQSGAGCPAGVKYYNVPGVLSATFPYPAMSHSQVRYFGNNGVPQFCIKCNNGNVGEVVGVSGYNCPL